MTKEPNPCPCRSLSHLVSRVAGLGALLGHRLSPRPSALSQDGSLQCPSCKTIYGEKTGTQPRGKMEVFTFQMSLPGHEDCGTILIVYNIPHGIQVRGMAQEEPPWIFLESASEALPVPLCPPGSLKVPACPVRLPAIRSHSYWGLQPALRVVEAKR